MYICISYDTDLLALEGMTGLVEQWYNFVSKNRNLKIELRTKSSNIKAVKYLKPLDNFILAWTLSPESFAAEHEKGAASLEERLEAADEMLEKGWKVRICFDPVIYIENFEKELNDLKRDYKIKNVSNMEELIIEKIKFFHYLEEGKAENPLVIKDSDKNGGILVMLTGKDKEIVSYLINTI